MILLRELLQNRRWIYCHSLEYIKKIKNYDNYIYEYVVKRFSPTSFIQDLFEKVDL